MNADSNRRDTAGETVPNLREIERRKKDAQWDETGESENLEAAAEDAYEWLIDLQHRLKSEFEIKRIQAAASQLRKFLDAEE